MNYRKMAGLLAIALIVAAAFVPSASATLVIDAGVGFAPTGVNYVNFDNLPLGNTGGVSNGITVSFTGSALALQGAVSGVAAPPVLSNNNGAPFGNVPASGVDTTTYVSTGTGSIEFALPGQEMYFGLLWGSVDTYNTLKFYNGAVLVGTITGSDVAANANGNQGTLGTYYVNVNSDLSFDRVVATSTSNAFEIDNVSYDEERQEEPVIPEPATLALMGLGLSGLGMVRRKKTAAKNRRS